MCNINYGGDGRIEKRVAVTLSSFLFDFIELRKLPPKVREQPQITLNPDALPAIIGIRVEYAILEIPDYPPPRFVNILTFNDTTYYIIIHRTKRP